MRRINTAKLIADEINFGRYSGEDKAAELQDAINQYLYDYSDEYKANVYAFIVDAWWEVQLSEFIVARSMELAA